MAFFRVKQVDRDGRFSYSRILKLSATSDNPISVYPNPAKHETTITVGNSLLGTIALLIDMNGKLLKRISINNTVQVSDVSNYTGGIYLLKMQDGSAVKIRKQ